MEDHSWCSLLLSAAGNCCFCPSIVGFVEMISASLVANEAHESAHNGIVFASEAPHGCLEFWMTALQRKLVVYRA